MPTIVKDSPVSSLLKRQLSRTAWARIHLLSFLAYILATAHYLQAGTERTNPVMLITVEVVTAAILFLTILRVLAHRRPKRAAPKRTAVAA